MAEFEVYGPKEVPVSRLATGGRMVATDRLHHFWSEFRSEDGVPERPGCYVFGVKTPRGMTPLYVGKTFRSMREECFTPHKLNIYNGGLGQYQRGRPIMFFLARSPQRGAIDKNEIKQLETHLIVTAFNKNQKLLNRQGRRMPKWKIPGVIRGGSGRPSGAAQKFKTMVGLV